MFPRAVSKISMPLLLVSLVYMAASMAALSPENYVASGKASHTRRSDTSDTPNQTMDFNGTPAYAKRSASRSRVRRAVGAVPVPGASISGETPCAAQAIQKRAVGTVADPAQLCGHSPPTLNARSIMHTRDSNPAEQVASSGQQLVKRSARFNVPTEAKKWGMARAWKRGKLMEAKKWGMARLWKRGAPDQERKWGNARAWK